MTSNALMPSGSLYLTADEFTVDPLQILRCDVRVFRCAPILDILLHILAASLAASKYFLWKHLQVICFFLLYTHNLNYSILLILEFANITGKPIPGYTARIDTTRCRKGRTENCTCGCSGKCSCSDTA